MGQKETQEEVPLYFQDDRTGKPINNWRREFVQSIREGDSNKIKLFTTQAADYSFHNVEFCSSFHAFRGEPNIWAMRETVKRGHIQAFMLLLAQSQVQDKLSIMYEAVQTNSTEVAKILLADEHIDPSEYLLLACNRNNLEMVSILLSSPRCYPQRSIPLCDKQIFKLVSETPSWKLYDQCTAKGKIDISLLDAINTKYQGGHNLASRAMKVAIETNQLDVLKYFVDHPLGDTSHLEQAANTGNSDLLNLVWDSLEKYCRVKGVGLESAWLLPAFTKAVEENNWNGFSGLLSRVHLFEWSKISTGSSVPVRLFDACVKPFLIPLHVELILVRALLPHVSNSVYAILLSRAILDSHRKTIMHCLLDASDKFLDPKEQLDVLRSLRTSFVLLSSGINAEYFFFFFFFFFPWANGTERDSRGSPSLLPR
eukprot:TRINITY_DN5444_c0_g1_i4.p1 TRINITY_DN5444_c0_g1~~TRINITY_DN5444_c0_g1_i4.p1  ORF type:complete len:426 (+),score=77.78 TRINITY_DN5444_c0_g1_i4:60-1337(+)